MSDVIEAGSGTAARRVSEAGGWAAVLLGAMVFTGWAVGNERLMSIDMRFLAMLPNTSVGMMATGGAILLLQVPTHRRVLAARTLATFVFLLAFIVLLSRQLGVELLHVGALFRERVTSYPYRPVGLFATNSTIAFMLSAVALWGISSDIRAARAVARLCSAIGIAIATIALLGHLYDAPALFAFDRFAGMALVTALAFMSIQVGILFLRPHEGAMSLVVERDLAGRLLRRLLPATVLVPIVFGAVWLAGREASFFSRESGVALFIVFLTAWNAGALLLSARYLRRADEARTRLLEREQTLRAAAEEASRTKSDFLGVMSHELRTPLNAIIGYVDLMESGISGPVSDAQRSHLTRIRSSASHLIRTVSDILSLTRLDAGSAITALEPVSLRQVLDEVVGILEPLARAKGLALTAHCPDGLVAVGDSHRLRQILINLGGNGVKFTSSGSVAIEAEARGNVIAVTVTDTGIGISPADQERIFDEFWQVEGDLTRRFDGAGLGLAVSRRLARQLGGDVTVTSELGGGSTFTVTVVSASLQAASGSVAAAPAMSPASPSFPA